MIKGRYLLFAGDNYYPAGGADDLLGAYDTVEEAQAAHDPEKDDFSGSWANILCLETLFIERSYYSNGVGTEPRGWTDHREAIHENNRCNKTS